MAGIQEGGGSHGILFLCRGEQHALTLAKCPRTKPSSGPPRLEVPNVALRGGMVVVDERECVK